MYLLKNISRSVSKDIRLWYILAILVLMFIPQAFSLEVEEIIPAYCAGYFSVRDVNGIWNTIDSSIPWKEIISDDEISTDISDINDFINLSLGVDINELADVFGNHIALCYIMPKPYYNNFPVIVAELDNTEVAKKLIQEIETNLKKDNKYIIKAPAGEYSGINFNQVEAVNANFIARYAFLDNLFIFTSKEEEFCTIVDVYNSKDVSLVYDPKFNNVISNISVDRDILMYINFENPLSAFIGGQNPGWYSFFETMSSIQIMSMSCSLALDSPDSSQEIYIYMGLDEHPLYSVLNKDRALVSPHIIPFTGSKAFLVFNFDDPSVSWDRIKPIIETVLNEDKYTFMQNMFNNIENESGLNINEDLIASLNGEIGISTSLRGALNAFRLPEILLEDGFIFFFGLKDRNLCENSLEKLFSYNGYGSGHIEYKSVKIYEVPFSLSPNSPLGYIFAGDLLIFGTLSSFEDIIEEEPPLVVSEDFLKITSKFPDNPNVLLYLNLENTGFMKYILSLDQQNINSKSASVGGTLEYMENGFKVNFVGSGERNFVDRLGYIFVLLGVKTY
ncbi:DUF3352 domain-containing protein [Candidatus Poribacteria bacterium]|nr:DUF3352 domain-containing protein [Candidatus Poribacteria bacterium]